MRGLKGHCLSLLTAVSIAAALLGSSATAHVILADSPENARWHAPPESMAITFLGKEAKEKAVLVLKKQVVLGSVFSIESDAPTINLRSGNAPSVSFSTSAGVDGVTTRISAGAGPTPELRWNNSEKPRLRGKWIEIVLDKDDTLTVELENTTFATVKFENVQAPAPVPTEMVPSTKGTPNDAGPSSLGHGFLQGAKKSVFQIQILDAQKHAFAGGTGFVVTDDGFAVTDFHVVQGGSGAIALFDDNPKPIPIELWNVQPEHDLALLHLARREDRAKYDPVVIANSIPVAGDDVWALGYPLGFGYTVTKGVVNGIRDLAGFPDDERRFLKSFANDSHWIQTDCTLNPGNSGGPLIDEKGEVVGVNSWISFKGANLNFCLSASHLSQLIQHKTDAAITFSGAGPQFAESQNPWSDIPRPPIVKETPPNCTPAQLIAATRGFADGVSRKCPRCNGSGKLTVSVQVGSHKDGAFVVPDYQDRQVICDRCQGKGFERATDDVLNRLAATFLRTLAGVKRSEPASSDAISKAYKMITDSMIGDHDTWVLLTTNGRSILSQKSPPPGTPVIAKVAVLQALPMQEDQYAFIVQIVGTSQLAYVVEPVSADVVESGQALMGGLIEGTGLTNGKERAIPVLKNGFLIAPPVDGKWWWWTTDSKTRGR